MLPLELVTAYQNADYYVLKKVPFKFKIGVFSVDLKNLLKENRVRTGYLISAYNPKSQPTTQIQNIEKHRLLNNSLIKDNSLFYETVSKDPLDKWPCEYGFIVLNTSKKRAIELGIEFRQNAIVFVDHKALSRLILLR